MKLLIFHFKNETMERVSWRTGRTGYYRLELATAEQDIRQEPSCTPIIHPTSVLRSSPNVLSILEPCTGEWAPNFSTHIGIRCWW